MYSINDMWLGCMLDELPVFMVWGVGVKGLREGVVVRR